jgi:hypothetical protein
MQRTAHVNINQLHAYTHPKDYTYTYMRVHTLPLTHAITRTYTRMHHVHTHAVTRNTHRTNTCLNVKCILGLSACFKYLVWCMAYKDSEPEFTVSSDPHIGTGSGNLLITSHTIQAQASALISARTSTLEHSAAQSSTQRHQAAPTTTAMVRHSYEPGPHPPSEQRWSMNAEL